MFLVPCDFGSAHCDLFYYLGAVAVHREVVANGYSEVICFSYLVYAFDVRVRESFLGSPLAPLTLVR